MSNFDDLLQIQQRINNICNPILQSVNMDAIIAANNALTESMANIPTSQQVLYAMQESWENIKKIIQSSMDIDYSQIVNISESMQAVAESIQSNMELINIDRAVFKQNYADMILRLSSIGYNFSELVQRACDEINDEKFIEEDFSSNEEIVETLQEQVDNPKGFQEKFANWSEAKKKKYYILVGIILFIWINVFQPYFQENIGKPVATYTISKVKELPKAAGKVIDELKKDFQAVITEDVPYYYKVTYTDENGNVKEGYVAKKNLKIIEIEEGTDNDVEVEE